MKRILGVVAITLIALTSACGGEDPEGGEPTSSASATPSGSQATNDNPAEALIACMIAGSPWSISTTDLEGQFAGVMSGVNVTEARVTGTQTLVVTGAVTGTFTTNLTVTIAVDSDGHEIKIVQKQRGTASGPWSLAGNVLTPSADWSGGLDTTSKAFYDGHPTADFPFESPAAQLGEIPLTTTCEGGYLNMSTPKSPFVYLWTRAR